MPILGKLGMLNARAAQALSARDAAVLGSESYRPAGLLSDASPKVCGAVGCAGGWSKPWKNRRRRPIFEDEWGCSGRCLQAMVRGAVRREVGEAGEDIPHRHRVPLGLVLLAQGWITHPQLQQALEAQRASGQGRIGDWLTQSCGLPEEHITRGLGVQWSCPVLGTDGFSPAAMALVMPKRFVTEFGLVPVRVAGSTLLYIGFQDRMNAVAALGLEQMTGLKVESGVMQATAFAEAKASVLAAEGVPVTMHSAADADELTAGIARVLEARHPLGSRLVRVHGYYWLRMWLESGARSGVGTLPRSTEDMQDCLFTIGGKSAV